MFCVANTFWAARVFVRASATRIQSWFFAPMSKLAGLPFCDRWRIGKRVLCFKFQQNHHKFDESVTAVARADRLSRLSRSVASHRFVFAPRRARPAAIDFLPRRDTFRNHYSGNAAQLLFLMSEKGAGLEMTVTRRAEAYIVARTTKRDERRSVTRLRAIAQSRKDYWWSTCVRCYYVMA